MIRKKSKNKVADETSTDTKLIKHDFMIHILFPFVRIFALIKYILCSFVNHYILDGERKKKRRKETHNTNEVYRGKHRKQDVCFYFVG